MAQRAATILLTFAVVSAGRAQSININIGPPEMLPPSTYGAAGQPGVWNSVNTAQGAYTYNLLDINGAPTSARFNQIGGSELLSDDDPATTGDDDALMDDCLITYTPTLETCTWVKDLQPGTYELLFYAWMPNGPEVMSYVSSDQEPGFPHKVIGGAWPGQHRQGVTYSRHICYVAAGSTPQIAAHSGIVPGANAADGAAANGLQIRLLPPKAPGDMNCDGSVNAGDIAGFVQAITSDEAYSLANPSCNITNADMNDDQYQDLSDLPGFVSALLGS
jgi:hypothetical protein